MYISLRQLGALALPALLLPAALAADVDARQAAPTSSIMSATGLTPAESAASASSSMAQMSALESYSLSLASASAASAASAASVQATASPTNGGGKVMASSGAERVAAELVTEVVVGGSLVLLGLL